MINLKYEIVDLSEKKKIKIDKEIARDIDIGFNKSIPKRIKNNAKIYKNDDSDVSGAMEPKKEVSGDIEKSVSAINNMTANHLQFEAIKLNKRQSKLLAILRDCPLFSEALETKIRFSRYEKAWITDEIKAVHKESQKAVVNELMSKKVKKAIERLNKVGGGSDNW